ncbi:MAG TPA: prepilin-type N-terminal cleavage/methylation domain-containing protein [Rickettsiales bacterium]|nr:prepilin-type N-terminal cleavage/methylation domain-containing protein [Rickettsiales bacterium]
MQQRKNIQGFTLIELSIVLVIIGLIIGGILAGRDLIGAAEARAQISQMEKYNTAVYTFRAKYGGLPGDLQLNLANQFGLWTAACDGSYGNRDGNGLVDGYYPTSYVLQYTETSLFWADLSQAGLIDGSFPGSGGAYAGSWCGGYNADLTLAQGSSYIGNYFPAAKIGSGNFIYVYNGQLPADSCCGGNNWYGLSAVTTVYTTGGTASNTTLSVAQAYNIDKKMDDGVPDAGSVQANYLTGWYVYQTNMQASDSATSCFNSTNHTYSMRINGGNGRNCALSFKFR